MPKVSYVDLKIKNQTKRYDIFYSKTNMFEIKGLPKELLDMTHVITSRQSTEAKLIEAVREAIETYHNIISKQTKVIIYRIVLTSEMIMNKVGQGQYVGANKSLPAKLERKTGSFGFDHHRLGTEFGFKLEYEVMCEVNDNGCTYWQMNEDGTLRDKRSLMKDHLVMKWSAEREAFFAMLHDNTKTMISKMLAFFGKDDEELLPLIDAGGQKLLS